MNFIRDLLEILSHWFSHDEIIESLLVLLITYIGTTALKVIYKRFRKYQITQEQRSTEWNITLIDAVFRPFSLLIWVLGISFSLSILQRQYPDISLFELINPIKEVLIISLVLWFLLRLVKQASFNYIGHKKRHGETVDETSVHAISQICRAIIFILSGLIAMQLLGIPLSGVIAFGGVGAAAVGFAAKDLLGNFFGGMMIFLDRPFKVGDWIRSPDRQIEGTVEFIGWRLTCIRTFDKRPLYVPNGVFSNIIVENPSRMHNRRIYATLGLRYNDANKIPHITEAIETMLRQHSEIDTSQTLMVYLSKLSASTLDIVIYTFTKTTNWVQFQKIQQDILLKCMDIVNECGAECAFPTTTLNVPGASANLALTS
ncbi:MAG: mechanosensitive ion channel family protein [Gammaproteobacteria bacterium]